MKVLLKTLALIIFYTMVFPPLLVASFVFLWSSFTPPEYLLGSAFFEFIGGVNFGFWGVVCFTRLRQIVKQFKELAST